MTFQGLHFISTATGEFPINCMEQGGDESMWEDYRYAKAILTTARHINLSS